MKSFISAKSILVVIITQLNLMLLTLAGCQSTVSKSEEITGDTQIISTKKLTNKIRPDQLKPGQTVDIFDGESMGQWKIADFDGTGKVHITDGAIVMEQGNDMTGIVWSGSVVPMNYEIFLKAQRIKGEDFFCGLTFPVAKSCCSFICGGWGGTLCGLSNLDYNDAANNVTATTKTFKKNRWYSIRVRVTENKIETWIDKEKMVDVITTDRKISVRYEVEPCQPLGIATWQTTGAVRNIKIRKLTPVEIKAVNDSIEDSYYF